MISRIDFILFQIVNGLAGSSVILDKTMIFLAGWWFTYLLICGFFVFLFFKVKNRKKIFLQTLASVILSRLIIAETIRFFFYKSRPFLVLESAKKLIETWAIEPWPSEYFNSFPSGHATFFFALATAVFIENRKVGSIFFIASFLIVLAKVFIGLHWPSDVLAGAAIGILSALTIRFVVKKWE